MKKYLLIALTFVAAFGLAACGDAAEEVTAPVEEAAPTEEDVLTEDVASPEAEDAADANISQSLQIAFDDRMYTELTISEIPTFSGTASELDAMNQAISDAHAAFEARISEDAATEKISFPVSTPRYVQVVTHFRSYQDDGMFGDVISINYDVERDDYITLADIFGNGVNDMGSLLSEIATVYEQEHAGSTVIDAEIVAFFIREAIDADLPQYYVKMQVEDAAGMMSTVLATYLQDAALLEIIEDTVMIVDPLVVDEYDPPLMVNNVATSLAELGLSQAGTAANSPDGMGTIIVNFTNGVSYYHPDQIMEFDFEYEGDLSIQAIADALTVESGLDFFINSATIESGDAYVDWSANSSLVAGYDGRALEEMFFNYFSDNASINWFMLDSLKDSIILNTGAENVYYSMNGGEALVVKDMPANVEFSLDMPYPGSDYYYEQQGHDFEITAGTWHISVDGEPTTLIMDGNGSFEAINSDGSMAYNGSLVPGYTSNSGYTAFDIVDESGAIINTFRVPKNSENRVVDFGQIGENVDYYPQ